MYISDCKTGKCKGFIIERCLPVFVLVCLMSSPVYEY